MRLDKYLKVSRLIKRRTVANEACDAGKILVNDKAARASYDVKPGDLIEIQMGQKSLKVRVEQVSEVVRKEDAARTVCRRFRVKQKSQYRSGQQMLSAFFGHHLHE